MEEPTPKFDRLVKPDLRPAGPAVDRPLKPLTARDALKVKAPSPEAATEPHKPFTVSQRVLLVALLAVVVALAWLSWVVLTPVFGTVVGYADAQPPLELIQPPLGKSPPSEVDRIRGIAQLHLEYRTDLADMYWPEPVAIAERPGCWLIAYARRVPIYRFLGIRQVVQPTDKYMFLSIDKKDLSLRFGKWCQ